MDIVGEVKSLNLPEGSYIVFGSGPLAIRNIRETEDIDLLVSPRLYQRLKEQGWEERAWPSGSKYLAYSNFEAEQDWDYGSYCPTLEELLESADFFDGVPFANLTEVIRWKKAFGRKKDLHDVALIEDYLRSNL